MKGASVTSRKERTDVGLGTPGLHRIVSTRRLTGTAAWEVCAGGVLQDAVGIWIQEWVSELGSPQRRIGGAQDGKESVATRR